MDFSDDGLWIDNLSDECGQSIRKAVYGFRAENNLADGDWHVRAFKSSAGGRLDIWVGQPPNPTKRVRYSISHDRSAGAAILDVLQRLNAGDAVQGNDASPVG